MHGLQVCRWTSQVIFLRRPQATRHRPQATGHRQRERPHGRPAQFAYLCKPQLNNSKPAQQDTGRRTPSSELTDEESFRDFFVARQQLRFLIVGSLLVRKVYHQHSSFRTALASELFLPTSQLLFSASVFGIKIRRSAQLLQGTTILRRPYSRLGTDLSNRSHSAPHRISISSSQLAPAQIQSTNLFNPPHCPPPKKKSLLHHFLQ